MAELLSTLLDSLRYGDLPGHLAAWWRVARGRVDVEDVVVLNEEEAFWTLLSLVMGESDAPR